MFPERLIRRLEKFTHGELKCQVLRRLQNEIPLGSVFFHDFTKVKEFSKLTSIDSKR